jgi:hypothetical protein
MLSLALAFRGLAHAVAGVGAILKPRPCLLSQPPWCSRGRSSTGVRGLDHHPGPLLLCCEPDYRGLRRLCSDHGWRPDFHDFLHPDRDWRVRRVASFGCTAVHGTEGRRPFRTRTSELPASPGPGRLKKRPSYHIGPKSLSRNLFFGSWWSGLVVALLARIFCATRQCAESLVELTGCNEHLAEQSPSSAVGHCILTALRQSRSGGVEHPVIGGADDYGRMCCLENGLRPPGDLVPAP